MPLQLDLFAPPHSTSPLYGKATTLDWLPPCACGSREAIVGSSAGPHEARLICSGCTRFRAWLSASRVGLLTARTNGPSS
jgi:hypothetical protein